MNHSKDSDRIIVFENFGVGVVLRRVADSRSRKRERATTMSDVEDPNRVGAEDGGRKTSSRDEDPTDPCEEEKSGLVAPLLLWQ